MPLSRAAAASSSLLGLLDAFFRDCLELLAGLSQQGQHPLAHDLVAGLDGQAVAHRLHIVIERLAGRSQAGGDHADAAEIFSCTASSALAAGVGTDEMRLSCLVYRPR